MTCIETAMSALDFPDFETEAYCEKQNAAMLKRLARFAPSQHRFFCDLMGDISLRDRPDGDWLASRYARASLIIEGSDLLRRRKDLLFLTWGHPYWRFPDGQLKNLDIKLVKQLVYRRLRKIRPHVLAIGGVEARLSVELDGSKNWEGHIHLVVAGTSEAEINRAFRDARGARQRHEKPRRTAEIGHLPTRLGYSTKRIVKQHVA